MRSGRSSDPPRPAPITDAFYPCRDVAHAEVKRLEERAPQFNPHLERPPAIDRAECFLTALFLRRYVSHCARRCRYAQIQGAARLHGEIVATISILG
jgi:hypothetical protein